MTAPDVSVARRVPGIPARQRRLGVRLLAFAMGVWLFVGLVELFDPASGKTPSIHSHAAAASHARALPDAPADIDRPLVEARQQPGDVDLGD